MGVNEMASGGEAGGEAAELLARLQAQFGDMDVGGMLGANGINDQSTNYEEDDESSLEEPTAEELRAWQEMQYEKGRMKMEAKKIMDSGSGAKSALQRRRQNKTAQQRTLVREHEENVEADEWEHLAPAPDLGGATSAFFPTVLENDSGSGDGGDLELGGGVNPLLQKLVEGDPEVLGTKWTRLYSSSEGDGLSFRSLCDKIRGYDGPTVLLLGGIPSPSKYLGPTSHESRLSIGFFTTDSWIESSDYFGSNDDCFMFSLDHKKNDTKIIRPKERQSTKNLGAKRYMYCHPSSLSKFNRRSRDAPIQTNGSVHGIGIGGSASQPRIHITESLEECRALSFDPLFEDGDLLTEEYRKSLYYFDVDCIEMWGVGGEEWISDALSAQVRARENHAASLEKARKVDKSQFLEDFEHGLTSGNKPGIFGHRDLVEERCDL